MEFFGQGAPFAVLGVLEDQHVVVGAVDDDAFAGGQAGADLAVAEDGGAGIDADGADLDDAVGGDDHRPEGEGVRADGRDAEGIHRGADDRAAGRDVVGGGA